MTRPVPRGEPVEEFDLITGVSRVTRLPFANVPPSLPRWTASRCVCRLLPGRSTAFSQPGRDRRPRFAFRGLNEDSSVLRPACSLIPPKARLLAELRQLRCLRHRPRCFQVEPTITCYAMSPPLEVMGITRLSRRTRTPASPEILTSKSEILITGIRQVALNKHFSAKSQSPSIWPLCVERGALCVLSSNLSMCRTTHNA